jgi:hypothetical protein
MKLTVILATFFLFLNDVQSQDNWVGIQTGYGLGISKTDINGLYNVSGSIIETTPISLGDGLRVGVQYGRLFSDNIGIEFDVNYQKSGTVAIRNNQTSGSIQNTGIQINPNLFLNLALEKFNPYAKIGPVFAINTINIISTSTQSGATTVRDFDLSGDVSIGISTTVGMSYDIGNNFNLFGEINLISMSYAPSKGQTTSYKVNGVEYLSQLTTYDRDINFVDKLDMNNPITDPSLPQQSLKNHYPISSLSFLFGIRKFF